MTKQIVIILGVIFLAADVVQVELEVDSVSSLGGYSGSHGPSSSEIQDALSAMLSNDTVVVTKILALGGPSATEMFDRFLELFQKKYYTEGPFFRKIMNDVMMAFMTQLLVMFDVMHRMLKLTERVSPDMADQLQQAIDALSNEVKNFGNVQHTFWKSFPNMNKIPIENLTKCLPKLNIITVQVASNPCMALCAVIQKSQLPALEEAINKQKLCGNIPYCNMANEVSVKSAANTVCNSVKKVPKELEELVKLLVQQLNNFLQCLPGSSAT